MFYFLKLPTFSKILILLIVSIPLSGSLHATTKHLDYYTEEDKITAQALACALPSNSRRQIKLISKYSSAIGGTFATALQQETIEGYFRHSQSVKSSQRLAGYMAHLIIYGKTPLLRRLFDQPDWSVWQDLCTSLSETSSAINIVNLLEDVKDDILSTDHLSNIDKSSDFRQLVIHYANTCLTRLFYGCWGITDTPIDNVTLSNLKRIAFNIGIYSEDIEENSLVARICTNLDQTLNPHDFRRHELHYLAVTENILKGYRSVLSKTLMKLDDSIRSGFKKRGFTESSIQAMLQASKIGTTSSVYHSTRISEPLTSPLIIVDSYLRRYYRDSSQLKSLVAKGVEDQIVLALYYGNSYGFKRQSYGPDSSYLFPLYYGLNVPSLQQSIVNFLKENSLEAVFIPAAGEFSLLPIQQENFHKVMKQVSKDTKTTPFLRLFAISQSPGQTQPFVDAVKADFSTAGGLINDMEWVINLYELMEGIKKGDYNTFNYTTHRNFIELCLELASSSKLPFAKRRDLFGWLRDLRKSVYKDAPFQTKIAGAISSWFDQLPPMEQIRNKEWLERKGLKLRAPEPKPESKPAPSHFVTPPVYTALSSSPPLTQEEQDIVNLGAYCKDFKDANISNSNPYNSISISLDLFGKLRAILRKFGCLNADLSVNKKAWQKFYRKMALTYHPDKDKSKEVIFKELTLAYETINNYPHITTLFNFSF